jgi:hypothetical protein
MDGEPNYEHHPVMCTRNDRWEPLDMSLWFGEYDVRKTAYWSLLAGACGYTYGCHDIWQFYNGGKPIMNHASIPWQEAMHLPGASQVQHARTLVESRPYFSRVPDQSMLASPAGTGAERVQAARGSDGSYAFIYLPLGKPVKIKMDKISGPAARASWFDPRTAKWQSVGEYPNHGEREFTPPSSGPGNDWVLVLDDAS